MAYQRWGKTVEEAIRDVLMGLPSYKLPPRVLWNRCADTREGNAVLAEARRLATLPANQQLTDGQLIRLAYWGAAGDAA